MRRVLAFASVVEFGVGLALMLAPSLVARLFFGVAASGVDTVFARYFGIALVALSVGCWPGRRGAGADSPAFRGMLIYNGLVALYVTYLGPPYG